MDAGADTGDTPDTPVIAEPPFTAANCDVVIAGLTFDVVIIGTPDPMVPVVPITVVPADPMVPITVVRADPVVPVVPITVVPPDPVVPVVPIQQSCSKCTLHNSNDIPLIGPV